MLRKGQTYICQEKVVQSSLCLGAAQANPVHGQNQAGALPHARVLVGTGQGWGAGTAVGSAQTQRSTANEVFPLLTQT